MAVLDPVLERLSGRHLLGCVVWETEQVVDAHLCRCPAETATAVGIADDLAAHLPHNAAAVRTRLAETARHDPEMAHAAEDCLLRQVLVRIATGETPAALAAELARAALHAVGDNRGWVA